MLVAQLQLDPPKHTLSHHSSPSLAPKPTQNAPKPTTHHNHKHKTFTASLQPLTAQTQRLSSLDEHGEVLIPTREQLGYSHMFDLRNRLTPANMEQHEGVHEPRRLVYASLFPTSCSQVLLCSPPSRLPYTFQFISFRSRSAIFVNNLTVYPRLYHVQARLLVAAGFGRRSTGTTAQQRRPATSNGTATSRAYTNGHQPSTGREYDTR